MTGLIQVGGLIVDERRYEVSYGGQLLSQLPKSEFGVLRELARSADAIVDPQVVMVRAAGHSWERVEAFESMKVYVHRLRKRLAAAGIPRDAIRTVRGVGYMLQSELLEASPKACPMCGRSG